MKNEWKEEWRMNKIVKREYLVRNRNRTNNYVYNCQQYETIRSFKKNEFASKITLDDVY